MAEHTPGPWMNKKGAIKALSHGEWFTIARIERKKFTEEGIEINARLIAAAPDLLAAAKQVIERWEDFDLAAAVRKLAKAIEKAEGKVCDEPKN